MILKRRHRVPDLFEEISLKSTYYRHLKLFRIRRVR